MIVLAAYLFYNSLWSCIFLSPVIPIYVVLRKKEAYGKKISRKTMEFSDGMQAVSFALNTGYSIENAFAEAVGELELQRPVLHAGLRAQGVQDDGKQNKKKRKP